MQKKGNSSRRLLRKKPRKETERKSTFNSALDALQGGKLEKRGGRPTRGGKKKGGAVVLPICRKKKRGPPDLRFQIRRGN